MSKKTEQAVDMHAMRHSMAHTMARPFRSCGPRPCSGRAGGRERVYYDVDDLSSTLSVEGSLIKQLPISTR